MTIVTENDQNLPAEKAGMTKVGKRVKKEVIVTRAGISQGLYPFYDYLNQNSCYLCNYLFIDHLKGLKIRGGQKETHHPAQILVVVKEKQLSLTRIF